MNFGILHFFKKNTLFATLFLLPSIGSYAMEKPAEALSTFRFKIIDKTNNKDLTVTKVNFPAGTMAEEIATIKAKDATYGSLPIKIGSSQAQSEISMFAITHKTTPIPSLYVHIIAFKENKNDKLETILTYQSDTKLFKITKETIVTPTSGRENPLYDATFIIDNENLNKSKILLEAFQKDRAYILSILKELVPSLYQDILAVDPQGTNHILWTDELGQVTVSTKDGLPLIYMGSLVSQIPREQLKFIIAHELGHYALGHSTAISGFSEDLLKRAFGRSKENEADRFAIMQLGINIDDAIAAAKTLSSFSFKRPSALQANHPFWEERLKHFNDLRHELEARRRQPQTINWKEIATHYLKKIRGE